MVDPPVEPTPAGVTVSEMVDALLLYDEPMLNHRFHDLISRSADATQGALERVPQLITQAERHIRRGSVLWERIPQGEAGASFLAQGERMLLEAFLGLIESQIRLVTFMAQQAPTREARAAFDSGLAYDRNVAEVLRAEIPKLGAAPLPAEGLRSVQEEEPGGSLRSQVEAAIRESRGARRHPRVLFVSHVGLRHLRDEGCFPEAVTDVLGVPVVVDWGWEAPAFALQTFNSTPLEELIQHGRLVIEHPRTS